MKLFISAVLLAVVLFMPVKNLCQAANESGVGDVGVIITEAFELPDGIVIYRDSMLIPADCGCDPEMMIWVAPDNDPGFMMAPDS